MPLPSGFRLRDYVIDSLRSEAGNFSKVYQAHDAEGRHWAIKEFAPVQRYVRNQDGSIAPVSGKQKEFQWALRRFREEGRFLHGTSHPHIVHVREHFSDHGTHYVVMELFQESLEDMVRISGAQSQEVMLGWAAQIFHALSYCHSRDCLHLDLSPNNIMFRPDGSAALIDFGFGKLGRNPGSRSSKLVACEHYSAPEKHQHTSRDLDGRADVYSLAAVMNFALTGMEPIDCRERMSDKSGRGLAGDAVSQRNRRTDQALIDALDMAFRFRQADRLQSIDAFRNQIQHLFSVPVPQEVTEEQHVTNGLGTGHVATEDGGLTEDQRKQLAVVLLLIVLFSCALLLAISVT